MSHQYSRFIYILFGSILIAIGVTGCGGSGGALQTGQFAGIYSLSYSRQESYATLVIAANGTGIASAFADGSDYEGNCTVQNSGNYSCNLKAEDYADTTLTVSGRLWNQNQQKSGNVTMRMSQGAFQPGWSASGLATFKANSAGELFRGKYVGDMIGSIVSGRDSARLEVNLDVAGKLQGKIFYGDSVYEGSADINIFEDTKIVLKSNNESSDRVFVIHPELQYIDENDKRITGDFDIENHRHLGGSFQIFLTQDAP